MTPPVPSAIVAELLFTNRRWRIRPLTVFVLSAVSPRGVCLFSWPYLPPERLLAVLEWRHHRDRDVSTRPSCPGVGQPSLRSGVPPRSTSSTLSQQTTGHCHMPLVSTTAIRRLHRAGPGTGPVVKCAQASRIEPTACDRKKAGAAATRARTYLARRPRYFRSGIKTSI